MFAFSQIEPDRMGRLSRWDVPLNTWLGVRYGDALDSTAGVAVSRWAHDRWDDSAEISPELANKEFGIEGHLKFDAPVRIQTAAAKNERKRRELENASYMEAATHTTGGPKSLLGFGASLLGSISHPLDFGLMFLPVVGQEAKAAGLAKLGAGAFRQRLARGLISEEAIGVGRAARFTSRYIDASVGNAVTEIPVYLQKQADQANYGIDDSMLNIVVGGLLGASIHTGMDAIRSAFKGAGEFHEKLSPEMKEYLTQKQTENFLTDRPLDVTQEMRLDETAIREKVEADLRAEAEGAEAKVVTEERLNAEREQRITEYIERNTPERIEAARQEEIRKQQGEGKVLTEDEVKRYGKDTADVEAGSAAIKEDINTLKKNLEAHNQRELAEIKESEAKTAAKEKLDEEVKLAEEASYKPKDRAIDTAIDCILKNL